MHLYNYKNLLSSLVVLGREILLQFFVRMVDSGDLGAGVVALRAAGLFPLRALELNAWVALILLVLTGVYSIICALSNIHIFSHVLAIVSGHTNDAVTSHWVLLVLWGAEGIEETAVDILGVASVSIEFWYVVFCCFWKSCSRYIWHAVLVYDICFKLLVLRTVDFLSVVAY